MKFLKKIYQFLKDVTSDSRIPSQDKKILLALIALMVSPFDLIPDWIPIIGLLDDFIIAAIILDYFFDVLDPQILLSHFPWDMKNFIRLKKFAGLFTAFVPRVLKRKIWTFVGKPYR